MFASSSGASISSSRQNGLGLYLKQAEHQRDGGQRLLAARQQLHALQALARRLGDDLDAALERIVLVEQRQAGAAAAEQRAERLLEVVVDRRKRLGEALTRGLVDALDRLGRLRDRVDEILALRRQERVARLELVELLDRHHVHRAEAIDLRAQRGDRLLGAERVAVRAAITAAPGSDRSGCRRQVRPEAGPTTDRRSSSPSSTARRPQMTRASGVAAPSRSSCVHFDEHLVERRLHRVEARRSPDATGRLRRSRARCRARRRRRESIRAPRAPP